MDKLTVFCYNLLVHNVRMRVVTCSKVRESAMDGNPPRKAILYIEDDPANRILVRRVMEAHGYRVLEAENGMQGLEIAQREQVGAILVDIHMPEMDGFEVMARLRAIPQAASVPIIALTAMVMKGDRERTLEAGCSGYIQKPIDVDLLPEQVAAVLS
jgi:two-component system cell cycle response regulator DivK